MWAIYALTTMLGLLLAVERPAMQAILFQLVGNELLPSAVAANSTINSMSASRSDRPWPEHSSPYSTSGSVLPSTPRRTSS